MFESLKNEHENSKPLRNPNPNFRSFMFFFRTDLTIRKIIMSAVTLKTNLSHISISHLRSVLLYKKGGSNYGEPIDVIFSQDIFCPFWYCVHSSSRHWRYHRLLAEHIVLVAATLWSHGYYMSVCIIRQK